MSGRLVWVSDEETIERLGAVAFARLVTRRRLAAPTDPAEAVFLALWPHGWLDPEDADHRAAGIRNASAVLQALVVPSSSPTRSDNP